MRISEGALDYVCERLNVPPADAWGVATFYAADGTPEQVANDPVVVEAYLGRSMEAHK